jgi:phosphate transport system substrate-binding protein
MKVMYKVITVIAMSLVTLTLPSQIFAATINGGGGSPAEKLIMDWSRSKSGGKAIPINFNNTLANDLSTLQKGNIDFAILDTPLSEAELAKYNVQQIPFALNGISVVVNLTNTAAGNLKLDSSTLGKIFSGEIASWNDPAITALNPRHELPNTPIIIIHSGVFSSDYAALNNYLGTINAKWKSGDLSGRNREWPASSVFADKFDARIATIKSTPFSISYLPMQYIPGSTLSPVHLQNKDGKFVSLSDVGIIASTAGVNLNDGQSATLAITNKNGSSSWPISTFSFIVVNKDRLKTPEIAHLLGIINYGLKYDSLKPTLHNYVALPDKFSKPIIDKIDTLTSGANTTIVAKPVPESANQDKALEAAANKKRNDEELQRQRAEANTSAQEEKNRIAKQQAEEAARDKAMKEAKAAKLAAEEAIRAANEAKLQADQLAEKNRLIAKAAKDRADKEKAEKEEAERERIEKERAIQLRNQKDEDPLEAYRRSIK